MKAQNEVLGAGWERNLPGKTKAKGIAVISFSFEALKLIQIIISTIITHRQTIELNWNKTNCTN